VTLVGFVLLSFTVGVTLVVREAAGHGAEVLSP
jgi:hypothetical protein